MFFVDFFFFKKNWCGIRILKNRWKFNMNWLVRFMPMQLSKNLKQSCCGWEYGFLLLVIFFFWKSLIFSACVFFRWCIGRYVGWIRNRRSNWNVTRTIDNDPKFDQSIVNRYVVYSKRSSLNVPHVARTDLTYLQDQKNTTKVNIARTHNYNVALRKQKANK